VRSAEEDLHLGAQRVFSRVKIAKEKKQRLDLLLISSHISGHWIKCKSVEILPWMFCHAGKSV